MIEQSQIQEGPSMSFKIRKKKSSFFITCGLIFTFFIGLTAGYFSAHGITNGKFEAFTQEVFQNEVSGSSLTLHYSLAHPEKQGIRRKAASLGTIFPPMGSRKMENLKPFPEKFFKMKSPAAHLLFTIPWHIRKNRASHEKKPLLAPSPPT